MAGGGLVLDEECVRELARVQEGLCHPAQTGRGLEPAQGRAKQVSLEKYALDEKAGPKGLICLLNSCGLFVCFAATLCCVFG
ncbi:hypothetical protein QYF36_011394 [Acer negundo]|nr:hypothetical protein QYF36_011394 [Acer negundo]